MTNCNPQSKIILYIGVDQKGSIIKMLIDGYCSNLNCLLIIGGNLNHFSVISSSP